MPRETKLSKFEKESIKELYALKRLGKIHINTLRAAERKLISSTTINQMKKVMEKIYKKIEEDRKAKEEEIKKKAEEVRLRKEKQIKIEEEIKKANEDIRFKEILNFFIDKRRKEVFYKQLEKKLLRLEKGEYEQIEIKLPDDKVLFIKKFIELTNKIMIDKKLILEVNGSNYLLNDLTKERLLNVISDKFITGLAGGGYHASDAEFIAEFEFVDTITVSILKKKAKNKKASGEFFRFLNKTDIDLSEFQIYNQEQFNSFVHNEACLYYALKILGLNDEKLNSIKILIKNRNIPKSDIETLCQKIKIQIKLRQNTDQQTRTFIYGKEHKEIYNIGLIEEHYFAIKDVQYTKYSIKNYFNLIDVINFNTIINDKHKREKRFIDSFTLINIFVQNKEKYLDSMSFDNCNIANTQFYDKINDDVTNLNYDVEENTNLIIKKEKRETKKVFNNIFFDFETYKNKLNQHKPYLLCAYYEKEKKYRSFFGPYCAKDFLNSIQYDCRIIAHNVTYDYRFLIDELYNVNEISRGSRLIGCSARFGNFDIKIKDSYHLIGQPLKNFAAIFNLDVKKDVMPYDLYNEENINKKWIDLKECLKFVKNDEVEDFTNNVKNLNIINDDNEVDIIAYSKYYCNLDVEVLQKGYNIFKSWMNEHFIIDCDECLTIASLAHQYLINTDCYNEVYEIGGIPQMFIQSCVVGGRTMTNNNEKQTFNLEEDTNKKMQDFDAVSLYPSAMKRMKGFLKGTPKVLNNLTYDFIKQQDGYFVEIKIKSVGINRDFSLMSYKTEEGIRLFSNNMKEKLLRVDKCTLEDLIEFQKIEFEVIRGYYFNEGHNDKINNVIQYIFSKRLELKKLKNPAELTYKLIMNNAYGKSIMKPIESEIKIFTNEEKFNIFIERNYNWVHSFNKFGKENNKYKVKVVKKLNDHFNICQVGVEILSMSKRIMNEVMNIAEDNKIKIYYQDTDSMHIEEQDIEILENKFNEKYQRELIGKNMGQFHSDFDLKKCNNVYASRSIFLGKKSYIDELKGIDNEGNIKTGYHIRMKGIPNSCIEYTTKKLELKNPFELYIKLLNGSEINFDLTEGGVKANFEFTKDYKVMTKQKFDRKIKF